MNAFRLHCLHVPGILAVQFMPRRYPRHCLLDQAEQFRVLGDPRKIFLVVFKDAQFVGKVLSEGSSDRLRKFVGDFAVRP